MSKKYYIIVLVLLLAGLAAGVMIVPQNRDIAEMQMKDKLFAQAQYIYESEMAKGDLSIGVVSQITELYLQGGAIDRAIAVMEQFVGKHPENIEARQRLGTYYQYAQRNEDYLRNLEELNRLNPDPQRMKEMAEIYQFNTQYDKQIMALIKLSEDPASREPRHYTELANLLAAKKDFPQAIMTLKKMQQAYPYEFGPKEIQMLVTLTYEQGRLDEAFNEAKNWMTANTDPEQGANLIGIVLARDTPQRAAELLAMFTDEQIEQTQALLEHSILLQIATGQEAQAYVRLKALPEDKWSPVVLEQMVLLASAYGEKDLVKLILPRIDLSTIHETRLVRLAETAIVNNDDYLLAALVKTFPASQYAEAYPLLAAMLSLATGDTNADAVIEALYPLKLTTEQNLQMARVCAVYGKFGCTGTFINKLPAQNELSDGQIVLVGELYLQMNQWDMGNAYVREALKTRTSEPLLFIAAKYSAVAGDEASLGEWLVSYSEQVKMSMLRDVYFTAYNAKHYRSSLLVAKTMHQREESLTSRSDLANAYLKLTQYEQAAEMLRPQGSETLSKSDEDAYLQALSHLTTNPRWSRELVTYVGDRLRAKPPREQHMTLLYALINAKQMNAALPYIRELAMSEDGQWASLYADTLDKQGKHDEARVFWVKIASQRGTSEKTRTAIAYTLLERGYKSDAESIFKAQAESSKPDSQTVEALLYMWGPHVNDDQMAWLLKRYEHAGIADRDGWATLIARSANTDTLPEILHRHPELVRHKDVLEIYLQALIDENKFASTDSDFIRNAKDTGRTDLLHTFARTARANGFNKEARHAYDVLAEMKPHDQIILRDAALVSYSQADYESSGKYLARYVADKEAVAADPQAYLALHQYGELLRRNNDNRQSMEYYQMAYQRLELVNDTPEVLSLKAQSQIGMGKTEEGLATFAKAVELYPADEQLYADYVAALVEMKRYSEARTLLAQRDIAGSLKPMIDQALPLGGDDVAAYSLVNHDRNVLVKFKKPVDRGSSLTNENVKELPWVSYSSQGYDSLLVAAKPGYQLTADRQAALVKAAPSAGGVAYGREAEQNRLRYELLQARIDVETGHVYDAASRMKRLSGEYPNDSQVMGFAANVENYSGNWPQALQLLKTAHDLNPDNQDIIALQQSITRQHAQQLKLDFDWVGRGKNDEFITMLSGLVDATPNVQIGMSLQQNNAKAKNIRRADGRVGNFSDNKQQGELFVRYHDQPGWFTQVSLFGNNDTAGAGGYFQFLNPLGQTLFSAEWRKPYWEYTQAVLDDATRDRLAVTHTVKPTNKLTVSVGGGVNRYNTKSVSDVLEAASAELDAVYRLIDEQPYLAIGYSLDGEYTLDQKKGFDTLGGFTPLSPLRTREIHSIAVIGGWEFDSLTYAEASAGYSVDRLGGSGPALSGSITREFTPSLDGQLRAYYGIDTSETDNNLSRVGGYVRWRF